MSQRRVDVYLNLFQITNKSIVPLESIDEKTFNFRIFKKIDGWKALDQEIKNLRVSTSFSAFYYIAPIFWLFFGSVEFYATISGKSARTF